MKKLSTISALHYLRLVYRALLFLLALVLYILNKAVFRIGFEDTNWLFNKISPEILTLAIFCLIYIIEITVRFLPHKWESMGCQKVFKHNYLPSKASETQAPKKMSGWRTFAVAAAWIAFNVIIAIPYYIFDWYDSGILILVSLAYGVCDMICILFFCPFQTLFMLNKCCNTCRIYNWDFPMMCTPLAFIVFPFANIWSFIFAYVSVLLSVALLLHWEITYKLHPERFTENTNDSLACRYCEEKLCQHKKQLRYFLRVTRKKLLGKHEDHEIRAELANTCAMETMSAKEKEDLNLEED